MKKIALSIIFTLFGILIGYSAKKPSYVVVAYVTSWSEVIPNANVMTHINYAFGHVNDNFNGITISNPERLKQIVLLKKENPALKVILSIGGWGSGRFSEMADEENNRKAFAADCKRIMEVFNLDGIDIDWEYPGSNAANISSSPRDKKNFSLLMHDIRASIGTTAVLSMASPAWVDYYDFRNFINDLDFVNVMCYDMASVPIHHAALHESTIVGKGMTCEKAIAEHLKAGVPADKIVLGIPFYGHGTKEVGNYRKFKEITQIKNCTEKWDAKACVPYLIDVRGNIVLCFDNKRSVKTKCEYIKKQKLRGAMYWDYAGDDTKGTLSETIRKKLLP